MTAVGERPERAITRRPPATRPVVGFISTWPVYQGTTIDRYAHALMQGMRAAARDHDCDLLLGAGVSAGSRHSQWRTVWPIPSADTDLVPIGPWNTDGLIVVPDDLSDSQLAYVRDLQGTSLPVVLTTPEATGPRVVVDNAGGIRQALDHLIAHGHRRIAFIAGKEHRAGDSAERLKAFRDAMGAAGIELDARLLAFGEHRFEDGRAAMRRILDTGAAFTAFVASNDLSCLGAIAELREHGLDVPADVATIGFDDILDARSHAPPLTTVRHPTFALGYAAVSAILDRLARGPAAPPVVVEPTRLIVRQSCGCRPDRLDSPAAGSGDPRAQRDSLAQLMAQAAYGEGRNSTEQQLEQQCLGLLERLESAIADGDDRPLRQELRGLLDRTESRAEDAHAWQAAIAVLERNATTLGTAGPGAATNRAQELIDQVRAEVTQHTQRQTTRALLEHMDMMSRLGLLTAQLLATVEPASMSRILDEHLPGLGVRQLVACRYVGDEEDPSAEAEVLLSAGGSTIEPGTRFPTRAFPPAALRDGDGATQLLVLPLRVDDGPMGFVALATSSLEPAAAIVSNLATALRTAQLYREALEGRRMAEEASTLKSRFLSTVSHELRTPLSVVVGLSDIVLREAREEGSTAPGLVHDLERMAASAEHLGRLIDDVLDLASGESGGLRLMLEPVDLGEVLRGAAAAGREMAMARGLAFDASLPDVGPWLVGDRTRLGQVVLNLIGNAVKFTERGQVRLDAAADGDQVVVSVTDTGPGVEHDERELIFTEFHRSSRAARHGRGGLGLGLAIARQLIGLHGGTIEVASPVADGHGSRFWFTLRTIPRPGADVGAPDPLAVDAVTLPLEPDRLARLLARHRLEPDPGLQEPTVLVVDDDPDVLALHARIVVEAGARVVRASSGAQALAILSRDLPDLVLLDLSMPEGDGFAVLESLRAREATRDIPVIVVTGQSVADAQLARLGPGVRTILRKGMFTPRETAARIQAVLSGERRLASPTQQVVRRAVHYIEERFATPLNREEIARHVAISPDYLTDCFQQELGLTPMAYVSRCRIRRARELLASTDATVTSIALAVGFSEVSHFTRTFHREVGVSPRAYRRGDTAEPPGIDQQHPVSPQDHPRDASTEWPSRGHASADDPVDPA